MKTKLFLIVFISFLFSIGCSRTSNTGSKLNLSFEDIQNGKPRGWLIYPKKHYTVSLDSVIVKSGKYSIAIEYIEDSTCFLQFDQPVTLVLPNNYAGKNITLSGYIKTENVTHGYAGLWMRIDPQINPFTPIAFDNMDQNGITGTTGWKKYEITLPMNPARTKEIVFGGMLVGKGKMWLDDLHVTIDGKDISKAKTYEREMMPAEKDKEFDAGSNIVFPTLNSQKITDLELLGRIWGFLKYHHPEVGKGNYNWDYELFRILPEYLKIANNTKRDDFLLQWIKKYGEIPECTTCNISIETPADVFLKPDSSWIDESGMNQKLKEMLKEIYQNRFQGEQYYIQMVWEKGYRYPFFTNENLYSNMPYPDAGIRLLALYRYWNMIQYFYPNKYLANKNWNTVLREYIPKFISAKTELDYELAVLHLIGEIDDSNANLFGKIEKLNTLILKRNWIAPFQVKFIENQLVVTKYFIPELQETTGLKMGDIITQINGKAVKAIVDSIKEYYPASNEAARMRNIAYDIFRSSSQTIPINYISSNQSKQKDLTLYDRQSILQDMYKKDTTLCYKLLNDNSIGYITMKTIKEEDIENIKADFANTQGIIIDMRNSPSYLGSFTLESYFVSSNTPFAKFTHGNADNPGEFTFTLTFEIQGSDDSYHGKLVVLVNEDTQSSAEYLAMAFRAGNNTTIIGSQTAGANGFVSQITLPGGLATSISCVGVYYPDGRQTQRIGIVPDIVVKPTIKGIREGRDELLEKAVEIINNGK